jgi:glycosyltransferase involved in cell wall biosynthesis
MKILQVIYSLEHGGAERLVVDISNELSKHDNKIVIYTLRNDQISDQGFYKKEISDRVGYVNLKIDPGFKPWLTWKFYKILKKEKPDVVHCHLNLLVYFFLAAIIYRRKIRFIYTIHNSAETEIGSITERIIRKFFFKYGLFIPVAISDDTKRSFTDLFNLNNVKVIYNGRKFDGKSINYENVAKEIDKLKLTEETLVFCHVSRYDENQKNHKMLLTSFNKLRAEGFDVVLLVIGWGFEEAVHLKEMANDHIYFLGSKTNVYDYLYASDAFCLSSNFEGMPIALIEAFACGCVPICTPVGGMVNVIEQGITGFLSRTISQKDYYDALIQYINNRNSINKERLIKYYHDNFSIEKCASSYLKLYSGN